MAEFFLSGNPLSCDCEMDWLPSVNAAASAAATSSGGGGESRNPRVADLADLECSVDLGKAEDGRFKVSRAARCQTRNEISSTVHFSKCLMV